jgi:hypothetical protein
MSVLKILFWRLVGGFEDDHFLRHFSSILWRSPCIQDGFFHRMVSIHLPESVNSILFNHQTLKFLIRWSSWSMFQSKSPCGRFLSSRKSEWEIFSANSWDCSFNGIVLVVIPKSYLDASHTKHMLFITLNESFWCDSSVSHILAPLTKILRREPCAE